MSAKETVLKTLSESANPLKPGEIANLAGLEQKEVDKAIKALKDEGKVISPKRCYYAVNQ
jgi:hypothetical protein